MHQYVTQIYTSTKVPGNHDAHLLWVLIPKGPNHFKFSIDVAESTGKFFAIFAGTNDFVARYTTIYLRTITRQGTIDKLA